MFKAGSVLTNATVPLQYVQGDVIILLFEIRPVKVVLRTEWDRQNPLLHFFFSKFGLA